MALLDRMAGLVALAFAAFVGTSVALMGQPTGEQDGPERRHDGPPDAEVMFDRIDSDGDGVLNRDEFQAVHERIMERLQRRRERRGQSDGDRSRRGPRGSHRRGNQDERGHSHDHDDHGHHGQSDRRGYHDGHGPDEDHGHHDEYADRGPGPDRHYGRGARGPGRRHQRGEYARRGEGKFCPECGARRGGPRGERRRHARHGRRGPDQRQAFGDPRGPRRGMGEQRGAGMHGRQFARRRMAMMHGGMGQQFGPRPWFAGRQRPFAGQFARVGGPGMHRGPAGHGPGPHGFRGGDGPRRGPEFSGRGCPQCEKHGHNDGPRRKGKRRYGKDGRGGNDGVHRDGQSGPGADREGRHRRRHDRRGDHRKHRRHDRPERPDVESHESQDNPDKSQDSSSSEEQESSEEQKSDDSGDANDEPVDSDATAALDEEIVPMDIEGSVDTVAEPVAVDVSLDVSSPDPGAGEEIISESGTAAEPVDVATPAATATTASDDVVDEAAASVEEGTAATNVEALPSPETRDTPEDIQTDSLETVVVPPNGPDQPQGDSESATEV